MEYEKQEEQQAQFERFEQFESVRLANRRPPVSKTRKLLSRALSIGCICCMVGTVVLFKKTPSAGMFLFGTVILLVGMGSATKRKNTIGNSMELLLPVLGVGIMVFAGISLWGGAASFDRVEPWIPVAVLGLVVLAAVLKLIQLFAAHRADTTKCIETIMATCTLLKSIKGQSGIYSPVYSFDYNGKTYNVSTDRYTNINVPVVGESYEIFINPDDPNEFYRKTPVRFALSVIADVFFVMVVVGTLVLYLVKMER